MLLSFIRLAKLMSSVSALCCLLTIANWPIAALAQPPASCTCVWQGSFSKTAGRADLIASGTIVASKGNSMDLRIGQVLKDREVGGREFRQTIRIWGDNGKLCRPDVKQFPVNSQWLLGLRKISKVPDDGFNPNTPNISYGRAGDYYLSSCGVYWLGLNDNHVSGPLVKSQRWEWNDETMNPVLLDLVSAYFKGIIPEQALTEAAKPQTETKKLMEQTKRFLQQQ